MQTIRELLQKLKDLSQFRGPTRGDDGDDDEDVPPAMKRYTTVSSSFPKYVQPQDERVNWTPSTVPRPKVHYIKVQREDGPSTSSYFNSRLKSNSLTSGRSYADNYPYSRKDEHETTCIRHRLSLRNCTLLNKHDFENNKSHLPCTCSSKNSKNKDGYVLFKPATQVLREASLNNLYQGRLSNNRSPPYKSNGQVLEVNDDEDEDNDDCAIISSEEVNDGRSLRSYGEKRPNQDNLDDDVEILDPGYKVLLVKNPETRLNSVFSSIKKRSERDSHFLNILSPRKTNFFKSKPVSKPANLKVYKTGLGNYSFDLNRGSNSLLQKSFDLNESKSYGELLSQTKLTKTPRSSLLNRAMASRKKTPTFVRPTIIDLSDSEYSKFDRPIDTLHLKSSIDAALSTEASTSYRRISTVKKVESKTKKDETEHNPCEFTDYQNSLEQLMKNKKITGKSWLDNLSQKWAKISLHRENEIIKIEEDEEEEEIPELPVLTDAQEAKINMALRASPDTVLIQKFNMNIHQRDIETLRGLTWLNDEVINFYMNLIMERSQENGDKLPKVYGMNTFFYPRLLSGGHGAVKRWTRKVNIFSNDLILVPVHLGIHWCMSIIYLNDKKIKYYDSMGGKNNECCMALLKYLEDEKMDKQKESFKIEEWNLECVKDIPQQMNGSDCGMFSCMFAEYISRKAKISFTQADMPYFRRKMMYEILQGKLLMK